MLDSKRTNPKLKNKNRKLRKNESESRAANQEEILWTQTSWDVEVAFIIFWQKEKKSESKNRKICESGLSLDKKYQS
jgi:N-acetylmuramic acid 6-phosphate (MurNAc-6-P) etherase